MIEERLAGRVEVFEIGIPWNAGAVRARLFRELEVLGEHADGEFGWTLAVRCQPERLDSVLRDVERRDALTIATRADAAASEDVPAPLAEPAHAVDSAGA